MENYSSKSSPEIRKDIQAEADNLDQLDNKYEEQRCHIRLRPGMYIGRLGDGSNPDDGIYTMFKEIVDNAVDEYLMRFGDRIDISVEHGMVTVRDYGRGISLDKLVKSVTKICSIEKTDTADYTFRNIGLDGVGTKVVNALSSKFEITSWREGKCHTALFHEGVLVDDKYIDPGEEKSGTLVRFMPDSKIMPNYKYRLPVLAKRLQIYACLNKGLTLCLNGKKFHSPHGLLELIKYKSDDEKDNYPAISFYYKKPGLEFVLCPAEKSKERLYSFVNGLYTIDGGTHLSAFKMGIKQAINEYFKKNFAVHEIQKGIWGVISIWVLDGYFETAARNKFNDTRVQSLIRNAVKKSFLYFLQENPDKAKAFLNALETIRDYK